MYGIARAVGAAAADSNRTAFRRTEKKYKLYKAPTKPRQRRKDLIKTDLSNVVDFDLVLKAFNGGGETPPGVFRVQCGFGRPVFCFEDRPGFYFIPGALTVEEQCRWIRESLMDFPQPPNRTNHNVMYGPIHGLFDAVRDGKVLVEAESSDTDSHSRIFVFPEGSEDAGQGDSRNSIAASVLLRKLRWTTLGLQFDWSKRNYDVSFPHNKIPDELCLLAKKMAAPAMPLEEEFRPEAAIVNYFGPSDMLGGHLDDMEADWSKPIVSISLGCKAMFLLGGKSRNDSPIAMFLRSGDIVLMAGQARECYHGVPRIFTDEDNADVSHITSQFSCKEDLCLSEYIRTSRININIRQVN
ncbi:Alpha-ketoglutarate-dependent dioxygenase alkB [Acorus gramineus]|uniref:Alpha-ketoglutarate-dependent dioxygenase alkB n=1 Tax=Acorus gramineus TaxID=55184 RepID=A0AAV9B382_ACOGR|nr:Alpha-ketoglutarate-dependent dioxygenase alkB [Acorus gramineus]